jgi:uncharacterized iron-regulated membrane protein
MAPLRLAFGYLTGLQLVSATELDWSTLLATGLVVNICNAIVCRLVARNSGRPARAWTALGLVFGLWAVAVLLLSPKRA